jgi:hypothetical protein
MFMTILLEYSRYLNIKNKSFQEEMIERDMHITRYNQTKLFLPFNCYYQLPGIKKCILKLVRL